MELSRADFSFEKEYEAIKRNPYYLREVLQLKYTKGTVFYFLFQILCCSFVDDLVVQPIKFIHEKEQKEGAGSVFDFMNWKTVRQSKGKFFAIQV
jgi:hypothetical protein